MTTTRINLSGWLENARQALKAVTDQPSLEAQALLGGMLGQSRAWIFAHNDAELDDDAQLRLDSALIRRLKDEPLPYILGCWEFYGLEFDISPAVLIPRPETELLVDLARKWLDEHPHCRQAVDVGTGSGCIAAALLKWVPDLFVIATDLSRDALALAMRNFRKHDLLERAQLVRADLITPLAGPVDLLCANLPYIPSAVFRDLPVARFEPGLALYGGEDGLRLIEPLLEQAASRISPGGRILLEIESSLDDAVQKLACSIFPLAHIQLHPDLAGLPRVVTIDG